MNKLSEIYKNGLLGAHESAHIEQRIPFTESLPIWRIYLTASQCFTATYKQVVVHQLLQMFPPQFPILDSFGCDVLQQPITDIQQKMESADAMIAIVSPYYGMEMEQECSSCPVNSICNKKGSKCSLSYLHYQILLAKMYDLPVYVIAHDSANDNNKAIRAFDDNKRECQQECGKLHALQIANRNCGGDCNADLQKLLENAEKTKEMFNLINERHYLVINFSDIPSLKIAISSVLNMIENAFENTRAGIISYKSIVNYIEKSYLYDDVSSKGISNIFNDQDEVLSRIETLYDENELYGENKKVRVLCFRGNSFITDHEWGKYVFSKYTKKSSQIEIEFVLANLDDPNVIKRRWEAFSNDEEDFESFKKKYVNAMKRVKQILLDDEDDYECKLYIHNVAELPFRMVFLGEYLYLSFFLNSVKATNSTVYEVRRESPLYSACLEYYERIRKNSTLAKR